MRIVAPNRKLGILISGRGSNLQAIIDAIASRVLDAEVAVVVSNRVNAVGLQRGRNAGLACAFVDPRTYADRDAYDQALVELLRATVTLVPSGEFRTKIPLA